MAEKRKDRTGNPRKPVPTDWGNLFRDRGPGEPIKLPKLSAKLLAVPVAIIVLIWLATGIYSVGPGSQGVLKHFGREIGKTSPGLNYHLPWPIQTATVVNLEEIRTITIGFREVAPRQFNDVLDEALMLTRDENIVDVHAVVQYRVQDASRFLFNVKEVPQVIRGAAEVAIRAVAGNSPIDDILTERRAVIQSEIRSFLQELLNSYDAGVQITDLKLQEVDAPKQVRDAFHEVVRAREDKEKFVRQSEGYRQDVVPRARGEKEKVVAAAEAYKEQRVLQAQGDAAKFIKVLEEYQKAKDVTRLRLYLEAIEKILPGVEKVIIDSGVGSDVLPLLPLRGMSGNVVPPTLQPNP